MIKSQGIIDSALRVNQTKRKMKFIYFSIVLNTVVLEMNFTKNREPNTKHNTIASYASLETAMGSPLPVVVAEIVMQNIKERALATYKRTLPLRLRYDDDTLQPYTKTKSTIFTNISTDKTPTNNLLRRSRKMLKYLF